MRRANRLLSLHLILTLLFLYAPILTMVVLSFNDSGLPTSWSGLSLKWYKKLVSNGAILVPLANTLIVAIAAAAISSVIGTMLALSVSKIRPSPLINGFLYMPMVIPDIVLAIALLSFFALIGFPLGLPTVIIAHVVFCIAFVTAVVRTRLEGFDYSLIEASIDLGASRWKTFWRITLPALLPGVIGGALLSFTLSFDEFVIASFTAGPSNTAQTLPMKIYSMLRFGITPDINALATLTIFTSFMLVLLAQRFNKTTV
ncbi:ABC transporter permease [Mesorhizobium sp. ArgA1]